MNQTDMPVMSSQRPYLLRALWEWIADNGMTPHLLVDATVAGVRVPPGTVNDGKVVLNIAERAVAHLQIGNEDIAFSARFSGVTHAVIVPVQAVLAIYARETGQGMAMPPEPELEDAAQSDDENTADGDAAASSAQAGKGASADASAPAALSLVGGKDTDAEASADDGAASADGAGADDDDGPDFEPPDPQPPRPGGRPRLRVVK